MTKPTFISFPEVNLEGFQIVSGDMFAQGLRQAVPTLSMWTDSIMFNKNATAALNNCNRVSIAVNEKEKRILVVPVNEKDCDGVHWMSMNKEPNPRRITCKAFTSQLYEKWGWDTEYVYRGPGKIVTSENKVMLLFSFEAPDIWKARKEFNSSGVKK